MTYVTNHDFQFGILFKQATSKKPENVQPSFRMPSPPERTQSQRNTFVIVPLVMPQVLFRGKGRVNVDRNIQFPSLLKDRSEPLIVVELSLVMVVDQGSYEPVVLHATVQLVSCEVWLADWEESKAC